MEKRSVRSVLEVGPGDFIEVCGHLYRIGSNPAYNAQEIPRRWAIITTGGESVSMFDIARYYRADDLPGKQEGDRADC